MGISFEITIEDIIKRDIFQYSKVIAGNGGLGNQVTWTHILETDKFEPLINGNELILTTGSGLELDTINGTISLKNLIIKNTAGICIELGTHVNEISEEVIDLANQLDFPIIVFDHFVKFIDITQDLHSLIIHKHYHLLELLNELSMNFSELSLLPNGILKILENLFIYMNGVALYITGKPKSFYYPPEAKSIEGGIRTYIMKNNDNINKRQSMSIENKDFIFVPVKGSGITWGYLFLQLQENTSHNLIFPVLEQAALAIAQIMLRNRIIEERKQNAEDKLVRNLLYGKDFNLDEWKETIPILEKSFSFRLILIQNKKTEFEKKEGNRDESQLQKAILLRALLNQYSLTYVMSIGSNETAIIVFFNDNEINKSSIDHFSKIIEVIQHKSEKGIFEGEDYLLSVSSLNNRLSDMTNCYQEVKKVITLKKNGIKTSIFYEKIGIYRLLLNQTKDKLESYIKDLLQPLIDYDNKTNSELLQTLETYLECSCTKKESAERLFIVRQTLYHRLQKIEELLGEDFLEPNNRMALEIAIKANYILSFKER